MRLWRDWRLDLEGLAKNFFKNSLCIPGGIIPCPTRWAPATVPFPEAVHPFDRTRLSPDGQLWAHQVSAIIALSLCALVPNGADAGLEVVPAVLRTTDYDPRHRQRLRRFAPPNPGDFAYLSFALRIPRPAKTPTTNQERKTNP